MARDLQSTTVTLDGLAADEAHAALLTLGRAVDELDRAAHDGVDCVAGRKRRIVLVEVPDRAIITAAGTVNGVRRSDALLRRPASPHRSAHASRGERLLGTVSLAKPAASLRVEDASLHCCGELEFGGMDEQIGVRLSDIVVDVLVPAD